jgi:hypothetical protein
LPDGLYLPAQGRGRVYRVMALADLRTRLAALVGAAASNSRAIEAGAKPPTPRWVGFVGRWDFVERIRDLPVGTFVAIIKIL